MNDPKDAVFNEPIEAAQEDLRCGPERDVLFLAELRRTNDALERIASALEMIAGIPEEGGEQ